MRGVCEAGMLRAAREFMDRVVCAPSWVVFAVIFATVLLLFWAR